MVQHVARFCLAYPDVEERGLQPADGICDVHNGLQHDLGVQVLRKAVLDLDRVIEIDKKTRQMEPR